MEVDLRVARSQNAALLIANNMTERENVLFLCICFTASTFEAVDDIFSKH